ncbi:MAG: hypothetical protein ACO1OQ_02520 [Rufibacter sp.]
MVKKIYLLILLGWAAVGSTLGQTTSLGQPYYVELHNGERIYANRLQYKSPLFKQNYFLLDDSLKFAPETVKFFQSQDGFFARLTSGRRHSDFAQREQAGRISTYFVYRTDYNYSPGVGIGGYGYGYGGGYTTQRRVYYFSKDNGPLEPLSYKTLRTALADNPGSLESLQQYKRSQNIQTGMYIAGAGLMFAGFQQQTKSAQGSYSPLLFVGLGVALLPQILKFVRKDRLSEAIDIYNYSPVN